MQDFIIKICLCLIVSYAFGFNREKNHKTLGLRDVMFVMFGGTLFTIISLDFANDPNTDMLRIIYATILGIGFLGSGAIYKSKDGIHGMTTASLLWVGVSVSILIGFGMYLYAVVSSIIIYLLLNGKTSFHITSDKEGDM